MSLPARGPVRTLVAGLLALLCAGTSHAQAPASERLPALGFSIAQRPPGRTTDGPLFRRAKAALAAADGGDGAGFSRFLTPDAELQLSVFADGQRRQLPFDVQAVRAAAQSCLGPYSFDEGPSWAQLSWVCRTDAEAPLARLLSFNDSPELSLTIWFENGAIERIAAMEPIPIPGRPLLTMDAYQILQSRR